MNFYKLRGYTSCFIVVVAVVACLLVLYSMKQFENLPLTQGSHARMQFGILPLQQGNSCRVHAVWYPAAASDCRALVCSLRNCRCSRAATCAPMQFENLPLTQGSHARMQFGILPLQQGNSCRVHAVWYPAAASDCRALVCSLRNCCCSRAATCAPMQFENLPLQPGSSYVVSRVCMQRDGRIIRP
jgi:hypothetical protein